MADVRVAHLAHGVDGGVRAGDQRGVHEHAQRGGDRVLEAGGDVQVVG